MNERTKRTTNMLAYSHCHLQQMIRLRHTGTSFRKNKGAIGNGQTQVVWHWGEHTQILWNNNNDNYNYNTFTESINLAIRQRNRRARLCGLTQQAASFVQIHAEDAQHKRQHSNQHGDGHRQGSGSRVRSPLGEVNVLAQIGKGAETDPAPHHLQTGQRLIHRHHVRRTIDLDKREQTMRSGKSGSGTVHRPHIRLGQLKL